MLTNEIAIVGIDSEFGEFTDIDRVARALYVGEGATIDAGTNINPDTSVKAGLGTEVNKNREAELITSIVHASTTRMLEPLYLSDLSKSSAFSELLKPSNNSVPEQLDVIVIIEGSNENNTKTPYFVNDLSAESTVNSIKVVSQLSDALTLAIPLLDQDKLVALVGVNVALMTQTNAEINHSISFDGTFSSYHSISGVASILLAPKVLALNTQLPIYGQLTGLSVSSIEASAMTKTVLKSLEKSKDQHVSLVEVSALADEFEHALESSVLLKAYSQAASEDAITEQPLTRAISCARSITGNSGGFSQVLGLLRTVIALQQRYIPGINSWQAPAAENVLKWQASSFYFPTESRTWYPNSDGSKHCAAYSCLTQDSYCHMVLTEFTLEPLDILVNNVENECSNSIEPADITAQDIRLNGFIASSELHLVLVNGENETELQQHLLKLQLLLEGLSPVDKRHYLKVMADQQYQHYLTTSNKKYTLSLLAESCEELDKEIQLAQQGIKNVFVNLAQPERAKTTQWKTPKGSYFSAEPAAAKHNHHNEATNKDLEHASKNVCFMYPGIGATYVGLGRDLFQLFPEIYPDVANLADDIGSSLKDTLLNPRTISRLDFKALKQRDLALRGNLADIAEAGVGFACVFTKIFTNVFKVNADFATGYSMGEVSMYAALGCWQQPGLMSARLAKSSTFNERLCGDLLTLREHWNLPLPQSNGDIKSSDTKKPDTKILDIKSSDINILTTTEKAQAPIWESYTIKSTLAEVEAACIGETRVYCTIINTPDSVLLGGYPADCLRVIKQLGVRAMPLNMANAIHSAPAKAEYDDMVALYTMAVNARINTKLYSSSCYLPVPQLSKAIANAIAKCLCDRVDFPRLVNTLYNNGARVFIEMGPGRSLCSWVDKTLEHEQQKNQLKESELKQVKDKNSVSVPVNAKGVSDELTYFRAIAKLVSHGVKLDLNSLFYGSIIMQRKS